MRAFKIPHDSPKIKNKLLPTIRPNNLELSQVHDDTDSEAEDEEPESDRGWEKVVPEDSPIGEKDIRCD
eukprot:363902-Karenia_brevis.AAC.1